MSFSPMMPDQHLQGNRKRMSKRSCNRINPIVWLKANLLSLNADKTKFIIYSRLGHKAKGISTISDQATDIRIQRVTSLRYRGVIIDENLSYKEQCNRSRVKVAQGVGVIRRLQYFSPVKSFKKQKRKKNCICIYKNKLSVRYARLYLKYI